jgi:hypothetical protein
VRRLRAAHPGRAVEVWAEDEARLGLKPITRRVWWLKGRRPASSGRTKYEWLYVYGFARPATGATFTAILPRVKVEPMAAALAAFAAHADPDGAKLLVLIVDNAGWHRAKRLPVPANVRLHFLPPCTPELQPVEPFWVLVREAVANETYNRLADLRRVVRRRCRRLAGDRETVLLAVGFHWATRLER